MKVFEAMTQDVVCVSPEITLTEAARTMKDLDIGPLPVCDGDVLLGMVTDRDITVRATAEGCNPLHTPVSDIMTTELVCCLDTDDIRSAAKLMQNSQLRRLLVINNYGSLVGIVSLGDLVLRTGDKQLAGRTLEKVSVPASGETVL